MKKKLSYLLVFILTSMMIINSSILSFAQPDTSTANVLEEKYDQVDLITNFGIVMDYETGKILGGKNIHKMVYPASTTKIWTAYLVIKYAKDLDAFIEIEEDPYVEGSSMYLQKGEKFTVRELLQGLLIHSSNDAAEVLAKHVKGSISEFANLMNEEAKKAGALNTNFVNPHGLPDDNHHTTPYDMAMLARKCMSNELFREIVSTKSISFKRNNSTGSVVKFDRYFKNTNLFLTSDKTMKYKGKETAIKYDIVDGIKTGYTDLAGRCLISSAVKNDMRVITAVFKSTIPNVYADSRTLMDYAFDSYTSKTIVDKDEYTQSKRVLLTKEKEFIYQPKSGYKVILKRGESNDSSYSYKEDLDYSLPIYKGDKVGVLKIYNNNELEKTIDLISTSEIHSSFAFLTENKFVQILFKIILFVLGAFVLFVAFLLIRNKYSRKPKKKTKKQRPNPKASKKTDESQVKKVKRVKKADSSKKVKRVKKADDSRNIKKVKKTKRNK